MSFSVRIFLRRGILHLIAPFQRHAAATGQGANSKGIQGIDEPVDPLLVAGDLKAANWTNKNGEKVEGLEVVADYVGLDLTFGLEQSTPQPKATPTFSEEPF